jgi:hypothetical protein
MQMVHSVSCTHRRLCSTRQAIEAGHGVGGTAAAPSNPPLDIFSRLASDLDTEVFLNPN